MHTYSKWRESREFFAPSVLMNTVLKYRIFCPFPQRLIIPYSLHVNEAADLIWGYKMINIYNHKFTAPIVLEPKNAGGISFQILEENQIVFFFSHWLNLFPHFPISELSKTSPNSLIKLTVGQTLVRQLLKAWMR